MFHEPDTPASPSPPEIAFEPVPAASDEVRAQFTFAPEVPETVPSPRPATTPPPTTPPEPQPQVSPLDPSPSTFPSQHKEAHGDGSTRPRKKLIAGALALALAAAWASLDAPSPAEMWRSRLAGPVPVAERTHFTILVADLVGDDAGRTQTRLLSETLREVPVLQVLWSDRALGEINLGSAQVTLVQAERTGRQWLEARNADLLLWGEVIGGNLQLRFLSRDGGRFPSQSDSGLGAQLELPGNFSEALGLQLQAATLRFVFPNTEAEATRLVEAVRPVAEKLEDLLQDTLTMTPATRANLAHSYGLAMTTIAGGLAMTTLGEQSEQATYLEAAVVAFQSALQERTRERVPLSWAATQSNLGWALMGLGTALASQGESESGTARLDEAVVAFQAALQVFRRERVPFDWALTQYNLGQALTSLGARERGTGTLKEAVVAYRAALQVFTPERVPLDWAWTQYGLGWALTSLGERERGTATLEEAVVAYRAALQEYQVAGATYNIHDAEQDLQRAEKLLAQRRTP